MTVFIAMNKTGIATIASELQKIDEQRYATEVKLQKLEQVVSPALKWLETQTAYEMTGSALGWADELTVGTWTYYRDKKRKS